MLTTLTKPRAKRFRSISSLGRVYLAGPINGCSYDGATGWREYAKNMLGTFDIEVFSPMRGKSDLAEVECITDAHVTSLDNPMRTIPAVYSRDRFDVMRADVVIFNFAGAQTISTGTIFELAWASLLQTPTVVIRDADTSPLYNHPFIEAATDFRPRSLAEAIQIVLSILEP